MLRFTNYKDEHFDQCLNLFEKNCPQYFAENEKEDYINFLKESPFNYFAGIIDGQVVSSFGLSVTPGSNRARLSWVLVSPSLHSSGIGTNMVVRAKAFALEQGASVLEIAASHLSAPFFEKFGAITLKQTSDGWGNGMHRIDMELELI